MPFRPGPELSPALLPPAVRGRLAALDRLRDVWAAHQRRRPDDQWAEAQRIDVRRHVRELRAVDGPAPAPDPAPSGAAHPHGGAEEDALVAMAADSRAGLAPTGGYLARLAAALPWSGSPGATALAPVAAAARCETHPIVRAAHLHLLCGALLREQGPAERDGAPPPHRRPLAWAVASMALLRSGYPPLVMDRRLAERHTEALGADGVQDRLSAVTGLFADMGTASLRSELSRSAASRHAQPTGGRTLAVAVHRRLQELLRAGADSTVLVLRELDPAARASLSFGDRDGERHVRERLDAAAARARFDRGAGCWWVGLDLAVSDAALRLLTAVQDVGPSATGVLAVTADAQLTTREGVGEALDLADTECATLIPTDGVDERWPDVRAFVEDAVSRAIDQMTRAMR